MVVIGFAFLHFIRILEYELRLRPLVGPTLRLRLVWGYLRFARFASPRLFKEVFFTFKVIRHKSIIRNILRDAEPVFVVGAETVDRAGPDFVGGGVEDEGLRGGGDDPHVALQLVL